MFTFYVLNSVQDGFNVSVYKKFSFFDYHFIFHLLSFNFSPDLRILQDIR